MLLIDPHIFLPNPSTGLYDGKRVLEIKRDVKEIIRICRHKNWQVDCDSEGMKLIELNFIRKITDQVKDPELQTALLTLRQQFINRIHTANTYQARTWGVRPLFNNLSSKQDVQLADFTTRSALACLTNRGGAFFFVREVSGRNLEPCGVAHSIIFERTRWRIYLSSQGLTGAVPIPCIHHLRNIDVEWTTRYDMSLPNTGKFPFAPPDKWYLRKVDSVTTMFSKAVFLDRDGNGWAQPNTPGEPYHWDVYLANPVWRKLTGKWQVNICRHGAPKEQGSPGEIHH